MPPKNRFTSSDIINFERFCGELRNFPQFEKIEEWSLKSEWTEFSKQYFSSKRPTPKSIKAIYDFFRKNRKDVLSQISSNVPASVPAVVSTQEKMADQSPAIYFPNLTTIHNSVVVINSENASISPYSRPNGKTYQGHEGQITGSVLPLTEIQEDNPSRSTNFLGDKSVPINPPQHDFLSSSSIKTLNTSSCDSSKNIETNNGGRDIGSSKTCSLFEIEKVINVKIKDKKWDFVFSNSENHLPYKWTNFIADLLSEHLPNCCINFKRRKIYPSNSIYIFKFYFYCSIAGCKLDSTATISKDKILYITNKNTILEHQKGELKSYRSRFVRGDERLKLGKSVADLKYPSKEYHRRLANLDEKSFSLGNLKNTPLSKNIVKQCSYEYRNSLLEDKDVIKSIQILKNKYKHELKGKSVSGFIQFFSVEPLVVALWTEKDIELFHEMSNSHSLLVDATGAITLKKDRKEIFYFAFVSYDRSVKTEPVPHIELLTELSTTKTLKFILSRFLEDDMKRFNYTSFSVPLLCTTDFSWPIIKSLVESFNNETIEEYLTRSHIIVSGNATALEIPTTKRKTFIHISLCHVMKALSKKVNDHFDKKRKSEKVFVKYILSLLANTDTWSHICQVLQYFFKLLLSKYEEDCREAKNYLEEKAASEIETPFLNESENNCISGEDSEYRFEKCEENSEKLPIFEDEYLHKSKRSIFFKKCEVIFKNQLDLTDLPNNSNREPNAFYNSEFANYFINNWCGILPLWTRFHLGDQGRHGKTTPYTQWSKIFSDLDCIVNPPKTQGIVEFHHKSVKHVSLNSKRDRIDNVISNLFISKKSKHMQFLIALSKKKTVDKDKIKNSLPKRLASENWGKSSHKKISTGPGYYQKNFRKKRSKNLEEWEKFPIISWGGTYRPSCGNTVELINTCTLDNFLQILFVFYTSFTHEMRKLFESNNEYVMKLREAVQYLLTESFVEAKFFWFTSICNLEPNEEIGVLDGWSTDKQICFHFIRPIFLRGYTYECSSKHCPSHDIHSSIRNDTISDMTLQKPSSLNDTTVERSIYEWQYATSESASISCKGRFDDIPSHSDFISEEDRGETIVRCSGWRRVKDIKFLENPPFLLFEFSTFFANKVKSLDEIPKTINVYNEVYKFGGITSFLKNRNHFVGYIAYKDDILFYDGLPKEDPVLRKSLIPYINGEVSLICFIPVDSKDIIVSGNAKVGVVQNKSVDLDMGDEFESDSANANETVCHKDSIEDSPKKEHHRSNNDALLAKALADLDKENSSVSYLKPRGKNYRSKPRAKKSASLEELSFSGNCQRVLVSDLVPYLHFDRDIQQLPGKGKKYMSTLWNDLVRNGLRDTPSLSVSKKTGRGVIYDGNHRLTLMRNKKVKWVPLKVSYFFIEDDNDPSFPRVPKTYEEDDWPSQPTPENIGFKIKSSDQ